MPAVQNQLMQVRIVGHSDQQSVQTPLWYLSTSAAGISLLTVCSVIAWAVKTKLLPHLSNTYHCIGVYGAILGGLQTRLKGPDGAREFKTVRKLWTEKRFVEVDEAGGLTGPPMPSYVAATAEKTVFGTWTLNPATGVVTDTPTVRGKGGSMRIGGLLESDTLDTEPNLLKKPVMNNLNTFLSFIDGFTVAGAVEGVDAADVGKSVQLYILHEFDGGDYKLNKGTPPSENPADWVPAFTASQVPANSMKVAREVGSQVSRKRARNRYA